MKRLVTILLFLALLPLMLPCGFAICVCEDCSCAEEFETEVSCCGNPIEPGNDGRKPCARLSVKGIDGLATLGHLTMHLIDDLPESPVAAFFDVSFPRHSFLAAPLARPQEVPPSTTPLVI